MSNHDLTIANGPGINVRQDIEAAVQALGTNFQGSAAPLISYPCQIWADSANALLKIRNLANTAWITIGVMDTANLGHLPLTGGTIGGNLGITGTLAVTGAATFGGNTAAPTIWINGAAATYRSLASQTAGLSRWALFLGDATAESGSNAGSNFSIARYSDAGAFIDSPLSINRAGGGVTVAGNLFVNANLTVAAALTGNTANFSGAIAVTGAITGLASVNCTVPNGSNALYWSTVTGTRQWYAGCMNSGIYAIADQSASAQRLQIDTAGTVTVLQGLNVNGAFSWGSSATGGNQLALDGANAVIKALSWTTNGSLRWYMQSDGTSESGNNGSNFAFNAFNGATNIGQVYNIVRATRVVTFAVAIVNPSDRRLKTDIAPLDQAAAIIEQLQPVYYRKIAEPERRQVGLIAQDVAPIFPEVIYETADRSEDDGSAILGIDYVKLVPLLIAAVRELTARITTLEGRRLQ